MKKIIRVSSVPVIALTMAALTACEPNASDGALNVKATNTECSVSSDTAESGSRQFTIKNEGDIVTEFYLLGEDKLRIVAEKENIAPGAEATLSVSLQPGTYFTACKPGLRGANVGEAQFTVTGKPVEVSGQDKELFDKAVKDYVAFVKKEVTELEPKVTEFAEAYAAGDDDKARKLYAPTRTHYERIEPIAEALGVLDPRIDYREVDYLAEADILKKDDPTFTEWLGFHRMEKDLFPPKKGEKNADGSDAFAEWKPSTAKDRKRIADSLKADVKKLRKTVEADTFIKDQQINIATVSNGASDLLEEVAVSKVTGEEDWWSHTDLYDFAANVEGSKIAFDLVKPIAERKGAEGEKLIKEIEEEYTELNRLLGKYGSLDKGFVSYDTVTAEQQAELTHQIDKLREPLSKLTGTVLEIK
ncbi:MULTISPECIES: iron uptake system protein EfeO [Micrococcaceae]|uniref:iron uptake system protein EfeO n=1 Tax=Micrococcaceae TaxID=1268 RepID=UPI0008A1C1D2|nr:MULTISPECIES: iron uptake system protein EfeO [Micrococcaceae]MCG7305239.1 EfeM/EfeO family lipoprotein [Pseudoglutamicibacter albus]OFT24070.1 hypothetical protein HMPREF3175_02010 [Arthrobacter sp. HMSC08H08]OFT43179.1 hypothetical protein HMPREF3160_03290 [Arthrobacter sp. HMSC06H05]